jgi:hypothetical protein
MREMYDSEASKFGGNSGDVGAMAAVKVGLEANEA